jgi:hypothetical protein
MIPFLKNIIVIAICERFREHLDFQQDIVSLGTKHTTIGDKKSSPNVTFI